MSVDFVSWVATIYHDWSTLIRIGLIILGAIVLRIALLFAVKRVVKSIAASAKNRTKNESTSIANARVVQRARTMGSVLSNTFAWALYIIAITMILSELGVSVGALVAGAGIIGAALGFGAQSLVKDMLSGLFIVFEDQYGVGDKVDLGDAKGVVESVGLRVTQVRDAKGTLWYVRNGEFIRVGNSSQAKAKN